MASGFVWSSFSVPVVDSDSFSESESVPYETRDDMAADMLNVVKCPETEGRDFRCRGPSMKELFFFFNLLVIFFMAIHLKNINN